MTTTWTTIQSYLNNNLSIIPVYDNGEKAKRPAIHSWKQYQTQRITEAALWAAMETADTQAVAILAGAVSGNLEVIDIDVKNWYGIDATLFQAIQTLYPDLWAQLRIHRSPSGGYHILYRISDHEPGGNSKLCHKSGSKLAAIESRGEGGYVLAPPSQGYTVFMDNLIPTITWAQRCSLFAIAESLNEEMPRAKKQAESRKQVDTYYDENPYQHYNRSEEGATVLQQNGWTYLKASGPYQYYERPEQSEHGRIAASFNTATRLYYIFTTSTALEGGRAYNPATVLSILQFNGDHKQAYHHLIASGFGRIRPEVERNIIKKAAVNGTSLPANISPQAATDHTILRAHMSDNHPYGIFWEIDEEGKPQIDRLLLVHVAGELGYRLLDNALVRLSTNIIHPAEMRQLIDELLDYVREEEADTNHSIRRAYETFMERHGEYITTRLPIIQPDDILSDTREVCYKCYGNGVLQITADDSELLSYDHIDKLIRSSSIQPRNYLPHPSGRYSQFIDLAAGLSEHTLRTIGYLAHDYKDETTAYIVVLVEQCENPEDGGGSGKNVFCNLFRHITTITNKPGAQVKYDEKFLQSWNGERVLCLSDVPKSFDYAFLKDLSSNDAILKKLFKDERTVAVHNMPKFIIQTNFSYEVSDGGLRRRIIPIEFTDFFTKVGGIDVHFGCHFPRGWSDEDWGDYDRIMTQAIQEWLHSGLKLTRPSLSTGGWIKQFRQTYGYIAADMVEGCYSDWCRIGDITNEEWKRMIDQYYQENGVAVMHRPSAKRLHKAIHAYCEHHGVVFDGNRTLAGGISKGKSFVAGKVPF